MCKNVKKTGVRKIITIPEIKEAYLPVDNIAIPVINGFKNSSVLTTPSTGKL
ncbi:hypothetical protein ACFL25_00765 [Patescibacteria group bacterium]